MALPMSYQCLWIVAWGKKRRRRCSLSNGCKIRTLTWITAWSKSEQAQWCLTRLAKDRVCRWLWGCEAPCTVMWSWSHQSRRANSRVFKMITELRWARTTWIHLKRGKQRTSIQAKHHRKLSPRLSSTNKTLSFRPKCYSKLRTWKKDKQLHWMQWWSRCKINRPDVTKKCSRFLRTKIGKLNWCAKGRLKDTRSKTRSSRCSKKREVLLVKRWKLSFRASKSRVKLQLRGIQSWRQTIRISLRLRRRRQRESTKRLKCAKLRPNLFLRRRKESHL